MAADGNIPLAYGLWSRHVADQGTVQENMECLSHLLKQHGQPVNEVLLIGDRANLNDELALAYTDHGLRYLAGLQTGKKRHRELMTAIPEQQFYAHPLTDERGAQGYWGIPRQVLFEHEGRRVSHQALVVLSGPMCTSWRQTRATQLRALRQALCEVQAKIGQPHYRTPEAVQKHAHTQLKRSPVGKFMRVEAYADETGQLHLRWWLDHHTLWQAMQADGRYLFPAGTKDIPSLALPPPTERGRAA